MIAFLKNICNVLMSGLKYIRLCMKFGISIKCTLIFIGNRELGNVHTSTLSSQLLTDKLADI